MEEFPKGVGGHLPLGACGSPLCTTWQGNPWPAFLCGAIRPPSTGIRHYGGSQPMAASCPRASMATSRKAGSEGGSEPGTARLLHDKGLNHEQQPSFLILQHSMKVPSQSIQQEPWGRGCGGGEASDAHCPMDRKNDSPFLLTVSCPHDILWRGRPPAASRCLSKVECGESTGWLWEAISHAYPLTFHPLHSPRQRHCQDHCFANTDTEAERRKVICLLKGTRTDRKKLEFVKPSFREAHPSPAHSASGGPHSCHALAPQLTRPGPPHPHPGGPACWDRLCFPTKPSVVLGLTASQEHQLKRGSGP